MASRPAEGYRRQVAPQAAQPLPQVSAEAMGAGVGAAFAQLGAELHRGQVQGFVRERQLAADASWTRFSAGFADARERIAEVSREERLNAGEGHGAKMGELWAKEREALLEGIEDQQVRQRAELALGEFGSRFKVQEEDFELGLVVRRNIENVRDGLDVAANRVRRLENPDDFAAEQKTLYDFINGIQTLDADSREELLQEVDRKLASAYLQGQIDRDPTLAKGLIASGVYDEMLTPELVEQLGNVADVEIRRREAQAEQAIAQEIAAFKDEVGLVREYQSQGIDMTDELAELSQKALKLGDKELALELDGLVADNRYAKVYGGQTPVQIERSIAALRGVKAPTKEQERELAWLEKNQASLGSGFDRDPLGWAIKNGKSPPPVDMADPGTMVARAAWAKSFGASVGRPVGLLTQAEAQQFRAQLDSGAQGERTVLDLLGVLPAQQARAVARQIDPGDRGFEIMAALPSQTQGFALRGRDVLKADPKFFTKILNDDPDLEEEVLALNAEFEGALRGLNPVQRAAFKDTALRILAGKMDKQGSDFNALGYRRALHQALGGEGDPNAGGTQSKGGLGRWVDDSWFLVPDGMTPRQFSGRLQQEALRGKSRAVNPDGSPIDLRKVVPVAVGGGRYRLRTLGGEDVRAADGRPWEFIP